ncbi:hypothetical protein FOZ63_004845 [Perkinsus olseni]|uniref:Uncharacterized protein n=1 Tax=Perkinsus olseni TaxID=32597 RepID=A0A7J6RSU1_PEROL
MVTVHAAVEQLNSVISGKSLAASPEDDSFSAADDNDLMSVTTPARRYEDINEPPDEENTNNINDQDLHDKSFDDDFYAEMTNGKRRCLDGSSTGDDTCRG